MPQQLHIKRLAVRAIAAALCSVALTPAMAADWHVGPSGSAKGDGSAQRPWDLQTALASAPAGGKLRVAPGDTIWLHGGTYRGGFTSTLAGTQAKPIVVRQAAGERAIIDCKPRDARDNGLLAIGGQHTVYWGFEVTCSDPKRVTTLAGSWPSDIQRGGISIRGSHVKLINLLVHDTGGIGAWAEGEGGEIYGCLIYYNGWKGPDRGHGHAIYAQNRRGTKRLEDNILFNQFAYGIHCYGSEKAHLEGFDIVGNIGFGNGSLTGPEERTADIMIGGGTPVRRLKVSENCTSGGGLRCGYPWGVANEEAEIRDNYLVGALYVRDFSKLTVSGNTVIADDSIVWLEGSQGLKTSDYTWDRNTYYRTGGKRFAALVLRERKESRSLEFDAWRKQTSLDEHSTYQQAKPKGVKLSVRPNRYEPGRAHVAVYNWDLAEAVEVDLSKVLRDGQKFRIVSAQNFFGKEVTSGVYRGGMVRLPVRPTTPAQPVGMADAKLPITEPQFGAYVVLPGDEEKAKP